MEKDKRIRMFHAWFSWQSYPDGFTLLSDYTCDFLKLSCWPQYFGILNYLDGPVGGVLFATKKGDKIITSLVPNN